MMFRYMVAAAALGVVAGCGGTPEPGQTQAQSTVPTSPVAPSSVSPEARAWMERFCGVGRELAAAVRSVPGSESQSTNAEELRRWFVEYLGAGINGVTAATQRLGELGPSPVDGADRAVGDLTSRYTGLRELFTATRDKVQRLQPGFTEAEVGRIVGESMSMPKLSSLSVYPFEGIEITQTMRDARGSACAAVLLQPK